jgi:hypothetical protein
MPAPAKPEQMASLLKRPTVDQPASTDGPLLQRTLIAAPVAAQRMFDPDLSASLDTGAREPRLCAAFCG